ncbi:hypothetical protein [Psychromonas sp. MME2]|uniref:hypothetical protein n=1 Tax=unclassified Psychromonas TaxID=2614957 RepID=UPI00339C994E
MKFRSLFLPLVLLSPLALSAPNHLLKHVKGLSRDYYYIDFSRDALSYKHKDMVGGEHEKHYLLLGFEGDRFKVVIQSESSDVGYVMPDDSYIVESNIWNEKEQRMTITVVVISQQTWVDISFSAYPFAEYQLDVSKLTTSKF